MGISIETLALARKYANTISKDRSVNQEFLDGFVIQENISLIQFCCNSTIAISSLVFMVDDYDLCLGNFVLIRFILPSEMVVEGCSWQVSDFQQDCQREYEKTHTRQQFMHLIGRNFLED